MFERFLSYVSFKKLKLRLWKLENEILKASTADLAPLQHSAHPGVGSEVAFPSKFSSQQVISMSSSFMFHVCQGLNSHYFHIIGDGHQPNSRGLYTHLDPGSCDFPWEFVLKNKKLHTFQHPRSRPHDPSLEDDDVCYLRPPVSGSAVGQVVGTWARTMREPYLQSMILMNFHDFNHFKTLRWKKTSWKNQIQENYKCRVVDPKNCTPKSWSMLKLQSWDWNSDKEQTGQDSELSCTCYSAKHT